MKKRLAYLLIFALLIAAAVGDPIPVRADITPDQVFEMWSGASTLNKGDTVEVYFHVYKYETSGFTGVLEYDPNVLSLAEQDITVEAGGWKVAYNKGTAMLEVMNDAGAILPPLSNRRIITIKFKVEKSASSTTIRLRNTRVYGRFTVGTDGMREYGTVQTTINSGKVKNVTLATGAVTGENWILVPVRLNANDGFSDLSLLVSYDPARLSLESVTYADAIKSRVTESNVRIRADGKSTVNIVCADEYKGIGDLLWLNFYSAIPVSNSSTYSWTTSVRMTVDSVSGKDDIAYRSNEVSSTVTVGRMNRQPGDVNGNDTIDLLDALCVIQYYNKTRTLSVSELAAADVNRNGTVDLLDALLIIQYYNGMIESFR